MFFTSPVSAPFSPRPFPSWSLDGDFLPRDPGGVTKSPNVSLSSSTRLSLTTLLCCFSGVVASEAVLRSRWSFSRVSLGPAALSSRSIRSLDIESEVNSIRSTRGRSPSRSPMGVASTDMLSLAVSPGGGDEVRDGAELPLHPTASYQPNTCRGRHRQIDRHVYTQNAEMYRTICPVRYNTQH